MTSCKLVTKQQASLRLVKLDESDTPFIFVDTVRTTGYAYFNRLADQHDMHFESIFKFDKEDSIVKSIDDFYVNDNKSYFFDDCHYITGSAIEDDGPKLYDYILKHNIISDCMVGAYGGFFQKKVVNEQIVKFEVKGFFMICLINNDWLVKTIKLWNDFYSQPGRMSPKPDFSKYKSMLRPMGKGYYVPAVIFVTDKW